MVRRDGPIGARTRAGTITRLTLPQLRQGRERIPMSRPTPLSRVLFAGACLLSTQAGVVIFAVLGVCALLDLCIARGALTARFERVKSLMRLSRPNPPSPKPRPVAGALFVRVMAHDFRTKDALAHASHPESDPAHGVAGRG